MLRLPASRAARASSSLLSTAARQTSLVSRSLPLAACRHQSTQQKRSQQHAVSSPTLANIEKRWEHMPPQEQAELWMALRDRMTVDWHELTMAEKKASYWIAFGPHGPRALPDPNEKWYIIRQTFVLLGVSAIVFYIIRHFAGPAPRTMNKEWQEASNEYMKRQKIEAVTGVSSEGYTGPGMVQSSPLGKKPDEDEEEE